MKPQIFNAGHDEQFRSEVLRFVEALEAGRLNEDLVPEIEVAFAELGRVVDLDFEEVRRELISASRKQPEPATKSRTASVESDDERLARLPDAFTWRDLVRLWGISRSQAFVEIRILLAGKQIHETVPNSRDGRYSQSPDRPKKVERESPESRPPEKGESRRNPDRPKSVKRESPESRPPEKGGSRRSPDHPKRVKRESPESRPPYRDFVDQAEKPLNFAEIKPESVATQRVNELLDRLRAESAEVRAERDKALRDFVARREAGERFDMARVMTPFREAVESAELAQLQAESEARAALEHLKRSELTLIGNPHARGALPGIDFDTQYIYVGRVEEFVSTTALVEDAELFTTPSLDVALIVPRKRAKKGKARRGRFDQEAVEAFTAFHGQAPSRRDFMLKLPKSAGRDAGEAVLLIYTAAKEGEQEYVYHFFDIGEGASRPVRRIKDVYVVEGLEMTFDGIMN